MSRLRAQPGLYRRQLDIPDVDTKFIEAHKGLLCELLDTIMPGSEGQGTTAVKEFERRYGDLFHALPYDSHIVTVELTGEELALLTRIATNLSRGLMEVSGLQLRVIDADGANDRILEFFRTFRHPSLLQVLDQAAAGWRRCAMDPC